MKAMPSLFREMVRSTRKLVRWITRNPAEGNDTLSLGGNARTDVDFQFQLLDLDLIKVTGGL